MVSKRVFRFGNKLRWRRKDREKEGAAMMIQRRFRLKKKLLKKKRRRERGLRGCCRRWVRCLLRTLRRLCGCMSRCLSRWRLCRCIGRCISRVACRCLGCNKPPRKDQKGRSSGGGRMVTFAGDPRGKPRKKNQKKQGKLSKLKPAAAKPKTGGLKEMLAKAAAANADGGEVRPCLIECNCLMILLFSPLH